jgi:hypothetical protein
MLQCIIYKKQSGDTKAMGLSFMNLNHEECMKSTHLFLGTIADMKPEVQQKIHKNSVCYLTENTIRVLHKEESICLVKQ